MFPGKSFENFESLKCDYKQFWGDILKNSDDYKLHQTLIFGNKWIGKVTLENCGDWGGGRGGRPPRRVPPLTIPRLETQPLTILLSAPPPPHTFEVLPRHLVILSTTGDVITQKYKIPHDLGMSCEYIFKAILHHFQGTFKWCIKTWDKN
jgi:hypothetical protein